ncbi:hypothetical protein QBC32DRAFT_265570 [Pseudoneurospora amorphoporcata]|uniref:Inner centromere protein ARK-binding domain-containing protein n=1 Tax=Pseudoneurospora amorphoporcata TaxID=241081 RepID=A0AAN6SDV0_9PEZI|nr:hypothetical protein QBC32DRAFT_265570 [Pseudoneurospora amorphoporcata]
MAMRKPPRLPVGSVAWIAEERASALKVAEEEVEEFSNRNMAEIFKTPARPRGKTPRTLRKAPNTQVRVQPLASIFSATPQGSPNPFVLAPPANNNSSWTPKIRPDTPEADADAEADDEAHVPKNPTTPSTRRVSPRKSGVASAAKSPSPAKSVAAPSRQPSPLKPNNTPMRPPPSPAKPVTATPSKVRSPIKHLNGSPLPILSKSPTPVKATDSGYYGSQQLDIMDVDEVDKVVDADVDMGEPAQEPTVEFTQQSTQEPSQQPSQEPTQEQTEDLIRPSQELDQEPTQEEPEQEKESQDLGLQPAPTEPEQHASPVSQETAELPEETQPSEETVQPTVQYPRLPSPELDVARSSSPVHMLIPSPTRSIHAPSPKKAASPVKAPSPQKPASLENRLSPAKRLSPVKMASPQKAPSPEKILSPLKAMNVEEEESPVDDDSPEKAASPIKSPKKKSPEKASVVEQQPKTPAPVVQQAQPGENIVNDQADDKVDDDANSSMEASSPISPVKRLSSLNFASLPAREPMTSKKSLGNNRMSRTSHVDVTRTSFYHRQTGGKSLGHTTRQDFDDDDDDEMDVDEDHTQEPRTGKSYTQRLQDQISMLGKGQSMGPRPSKSIAHLLPAQQPPSTSQAPTTQPVPEPTKSSPKKPPAVTPRAFPTPGAFPLDDDDDWIGPPSKGADMSTPMMWNARKDTRLSQPMEGMNLFAREASPTLGESFMENRHDSPSKAPVIQEPPATSSAHIKSASVPMLPNLNELSVPHSASPKKEASASTSNLHKMPADEPASPFKSPSKAFHGNTLERVKNKFSSLMKSSKGLLPTSAPSTAEAKLTGLFTTPSTARLEENHSLSDASFKTADNVVYPDLSHHAQAEAPVAATPIRATRKTRALSERERKEAEEREKEKKKEEKEAKQYAKQNEKFEKMREKEAEKARLFQQEQERQVEMERRAAEQREQEKLAKARPQSKQLLETPGPSKSAPKSPKKATRTSLRRGAKQGDAEKEEADVDMADVTISTKPPQSIPRPPSAQASRGTGIKRPVRPTKEALTRAKPAPTRIRVNTTSSQQGAFHTSTNSVLSTTSQESLGQSHGRQQLVSKASTSSLTKKPSLQSLKGSYSSTVGRPKALELAAKQKEQEEREIQRRRDQKEANERKRAEMKEEEQRKQAAAAKKAAIEQAKRTRAPPPPPRSQPNGPPDHLAESRQPSRPNSRLGSTLHDSRPVNAVLGKAASKRPLTQVQQVQEAHQDSKRIRVSEDFDADIEMAEGSTQQQRSIRGAPVRPSAVRPSGVRPSAPVRQPSVGFKKDLSTTTTSKSIFASNYNNVPHAPPPPSRTVDLFKKTTVNQIKTGHALDTAQFQKGNHIPFASSNPNGAGGPSSAAQAGSSRHALQTPARPGGPAARALASATKPSRTSPRLAAMAAGDSIELPEIQTDDEDGVDTPRPSTSNPNLRSSLNGGNWTDSPFLKAQLLAQEQLDPMVIFGPPAPLNMEEVFSKDKSRHHRFRARTSSANWEGQDRLTEEEVCRDREARERMRVEGGWSWGLGRTLG